MTRRIVTLCAGVTLTAGSLVAQSPAFKSWAVREAPAEYQQVIARADVVIAAMQDAFLRELDGALAQGGPAFAIQSCHIDATAASQRLGRYEGIAAGRTSHRLRNPTNAPKAWAADIVREHAGRRARDVPGFAVDLGDKLGILRPIAHRASCAGCHGPKDALQEPVRKALTDRYPADKATGFVEGEIRGWFWVEIPKHPK